MTISPTAVHFDDQTMCVDLTDGRSLRVPLAWFPRLLHATPAQREHVELSRIGLHWENLNEDISIAGLLAGQGDNTAKATHDVPNVKNKPAPPKVFISHATEDKAFVIPFARALRTAGIDAWVDQWEIRPGDSLVQKIFEEGIGKAAVVIVALSRTSVTKKWVKEELDAAIVGRINQTSRLIPLVIEDCDIPIALQATKWIRARDGVDEVAKEVIRAIFGRTERPPVGSAPAYVQSPLPDLPGLDRIDLQVLYAIGERYLQKASSLVSKNDLLEQMRPLDVSASQIDESLEVLSEASYIIPNHAIGQKFAAVRLAQLGAAIVLRNRFPEFDTHFRQISLALINEGGTSNEEIAKSLSLPLILVNHVLDDLESQRLIQMSKSISGPRHVFEISARLKRAL